MKAKLSAMSTGIGFVASRVCERGLGEDFPRTPPLWLLIGIAALLATPVRGALTTNFWTDSNGLWEIGANWHDGVPSANGQSAISIAGGGFIAKTIFVSATTVLSNAINQCMTVSNLTVAGVTNPVIFNTLSLQNAGTTTPLHILNSFINTSSGGDVSLANLNITNSALQVDGRFSNDGNVSLNTGMGIANGDVVCGSTAGATGNVWFTDGHLIITNGTTYVGSGGAGQITVSNGTWLARDVAVGYGANSSQGTLTVAGGTNVFSSTLAVGSGVGGFGSGGTGTVWITGGQLTVTNGTTYAGYGVKGAGQIIVSNGTWSALGVELGYVASSQGTLTLAGGTTTFQQFEMDVGGANDATGTVWMTGGQLTASAIIGDNGAGSMTVSNGSWQGGSIIVDEGGELISGPTTNIYGAGTLTMTGGSIYMSDGLDISQQGGTTGTVWMTGGQLIAGLTDIGVTGVGRMTMSNGTCQSAFIRVGVTAGALGTLTVAGGTNSASLGLTIGSANCASTGFVNVIGGRLNVTNNDSNAVLDVESGVLALSAGELAVDQLIMTNPCARFVQTGGAFTTTGQAQVDQGTQTVMSGTSAIASNLLVGSLPGAVGFVNVLGGTLVVSNGVIGIGNDGTTTGSGGVGSMTISNATVTAGSVLLGSAAGGQGALDVRTSGRLNIRGDGRLATNDGLLDGGTIDGSDATLSVGENHVAAMTTSNGVATFRSAFIGFNNTGTLAMPGGAMTVLSNMVVGDCGAGVTGVVTVAGGSLYVTNATHTAYLDLRNGTFTLDSGTMVVDTLIMTNSCARLAHTGGTLIYGTLVLDPNLSAVGDGIPNGWKLQYGLDPFDANLGSEDPDGDGCNNLCEFLTGGNPVADIKSITKQGSDIALTWQAAANKTNALQATSGANGNYSNNFADIFTVTNNPGAVTNYLDVGGATNVPARFYRIRLVP